MHIIIWRAAFADYLQARQCGDGYACIRNPLCSARHETATKFEGSAREPCSSCLIVSGLLAKISVTRNSSSRYINRRFINEPAFS